MSWIADIPAKLRVVLITLNFSSHLLFIFRFIRFSSSASQGTSWIWSVLRKTNGDADTCSSRSDCDSDRRPSSACWTCFLSIVFTITTSGGETPCDPYPTLSPTGPYTYLLWQSLARLISNSSAVDLQVGRMRLTVTYWSADEKIQTSNIDCECVIGDSYLLFPKWLIFMDVNGSYRGKKMPLWQERIVD